MIAAFYERFGEQIANELNFQRFAELKSELEQRIASFESNMEQRMSALEATLERKLAAHTRCMFAVWAALFIPIIGLWFRG